MDLLLKTATQLTATTRDLWIKSGKLSWAPELVEAATYIMDGGKGARPALLLWSAVSTSQAVARGGEETASVEKIKEICAEAALALEMVHVYSLVHDDLPAMDNDDFRRGRPTLHKKYNEALAVLTGDALLTGAFEVLTHARCPDQSRVLLVRELALAAGGAGMIAGQVWDLEAERRQDPNLDLWTRIHDAKTGALFGAALAMGFVLGSDSISEGDVRDARRWGVRLGRLFQLVDDRLDKGPFFRELGEAPLMELCQKEAKSLQVEAQKIWRNPADLQEILDFFVNRTA